MNDNNISNVKNKASNLNGKAIMGLITTFIFVLITVLSTHSLNQKKNLSFNARAVTGSVTVVFSGSSQAVPGSKYTLTIKKSNSAPKVLVGSISFTYPSGFGVGQVKYDGTPFGIANIGQNSIQNGTGILVFQRSDPASISDPNESIAKIEFTPSSGSSGAFNFTEVAMADENADTLTTIKGASLSVSVGSSPNPTTPPGTQPTAPPGSQPTQTPNPTYGAASTINLNLKLKFQGITAKPKDEYNKLSVKVKLGGGALTQLTDYQTADFTADSTGIWSGSVSFTQIQVGGKYKVYIKGPKHLQKKVCASTPTETSSGTYSCSEGNITLVAGANDLDLSGIFQLVGDLPVQNGIVDSYDTTLVQTNLGKTDAEALRLADLNLDGKVDTQDHSLVIAALSLKADEE